MRDPARTVMFGGIAQTRRCRSARSGGAPAPFAGLSRAPRQQEEDHSTIPGIATSALTAKNQDTHVSASHPLAADNVLRVESPSADSSAYWLRRNRRAEARE